MVYNFFAVANVLDPEKSTLFGYIVDEEELQDFEKEFINLNIRRHIKEDNNLMC